MTMVGLGGGYAQHTSDELSKFYILVLFAGLFHLMNHAVLNALFMGVGIIDHESGTRDIRLLNGMRKVFLKCILSCCSLHYLWQVFLFKWLLSKEMF